MPPKISYDITGSTGSTGTAKPDFSSLKPDTEASVVQLNYQTPKIVYGTVLATLLVSGLYGALGALGAF